MERERDEDFPPPVFLTVPRGSEKKDPLSLSRPSLLLLYASRARRPRGPKKGGDRAHNMRRLTPYSTYT